MAIAGVADNAELTSRRLIEKMVKEGTKTFNVGIRDSIDGHSNRGGVSTNICTEVKPFKFVLVERTT